MNVTRAGHQGNPLIFAQTMEPAAKAVSTCHQIRLISSQQFNSRERFNISFEPLLLKQVICHSCGALIHNPCLSMDPLFVALLTLSLLYSADPVNNYTCYSQNVNNNQSMLSEKNHPNKVDILVILNK